MSRDTCMVMVLAPWLMRAGFEIGHRGPQNPLPINAMVLEEAVVLGGQECLNQLFGQLVVTHGNAALVANRGNQPPVARIDAQRHLQLNVAQTADIGQGGLQIDVSADIGEGNQ